jgi:hypothetical protein
MLYLIHFMKPYKHAGHYRGYCEDGKLDERLARHRSGSGARLIRVIQEAGIDWVLAATFPGGRKQERNLKKKSVKDICPICAVEQRDGVEQ